MAIAVVGDQPYLGLGIALAGPVEYPPLVRIADSQQRAEAERVRSWFREEFLNAL